MGRRLETMLRVLLVLARLNIEGSILCVMILQINLRNYGILMSLVERISVLGVNNVNVGGF